MPARILITEKQFGRLKILETNFIDKRGHSCSRCLCACGKEKVVRNAHLRSGAVKSCGCLSNDVRKFISTTHGQAKKHSNTKAYLSWVGMKGRCLNPRNKQFPDYGGRGIKVCDRWMKFENFFADMGAPALGLSIDRINNDGNYEPTNCRWATKVEQAGNKRNNHVIEFNGISGCLAHVAKSNGFSSQLIRDRIRRGLTVSEAFLKPKRKSPMRST